MTHRLTQLVVAVLAAELHELDHLAGSFELPVTSIQLGPQLVVARGPPTFLPPLSERRRAGQRSRLPDQNIQVVLEFINRLAAAVAALVACHDVALVPDLNFQRQ